MKTFYLKAFLQISTGFLFFLFFQKANAINRSGPINERALISSEISNPDTAKRVSKKKNTDPDKILDRDAVNEKEGRKDVDRDKKNPEDGVDDDIKARMKQEFDRIKDPGLNVVPVERLVLAKRVKEQMMLRKPAINHGITPSASINGLQWTERGPNNVGGRTRALLFDLNDAANGYKKVFAGAVGGG